MVLPNRESVNNEAFDTSRLLEKVLERNNMLLALKRVTRNKGSHGVDGMKIDELREHIMSMLFLKISGYNGLRDIDEMTDKKQGFITPQQSNAVTEESLSTSTEIEDVYDYLVTIGSNYSKNKTRHKYRKILYFTKDSDEKFRLVTNIYDMPAEENKISSLYLASDLIIFIKPFFILQST